MDARFGFALLFAFAACFTIPALIRVAHTLGDPADDDHRSVAECELPSPTLINKGA